ncbi:glycosyltransferase [Ideonella sp. BN130291]|uniref:glycosyltransferase n=1 Tax=Ideonella sp. BN130291 TaxID=3112940 RepID=UPI002E26EA00|nr:glycosyltransferase [Ideonella sp. BN130291]
MRLVLIGDGDSVHLLKWARALAPRVELWAASSRGFLPGFDAVLPAERRLALNSQPNFEGGNAALLRCLPALARWLRRVQPDWLHAHYLTSHGTLAWLSRSVFRVRGRIAGSAWGSDILVAPEQSAVLRWLTRRVLAACAVTTSDSQYMGQRMKALGAAEVMLLPFGLEAMPPRPQAKDDMLFFANRGLEAIYAPQRVLAVFAKVAAQWPQARLVVANDGSLRGELEHQVQAGGLAERVQFTGRLDAAAQAAYYGSARWYLSLPVSDAVSVSLLEAMAHGCVPLLSDLPANRELVRDGDNGLVLRDAAATDVMPALGTLLPRADDIAERNRAWVREHALFEPLVDRFVQRLQQLQSA